MGKNQSERGGRFGRKRQRKVERDGKSGGEKSVTKLDGKNVCLTTSKRGREILRDIFWCEHFLGIKKGMTLFGDRNQEGVGSVTQQGRGLVRDAVFGNKNRKGMDREKVSSFPVCQEGRKSGHSWSQRDIEQSRFLPPSPAKKAW